MNPGDFVVWTFIVIFIATAIITLGGLIGKVRVEPYYKKKLFYMLLAEVIGVVVFIAKTAVQPPTADLRTMLLGARNGWDWQYANKCWRGNVVFVEESGRIRLKGFFRDFSKPSRPVVVHLTSESFDLSGGARTIAFHVKKEHLGETAEDMKMTLAAGAMVVGEARSDKEQWGVVLTPGVPGLSLIHI